MAGTVTLGIGAVAGEQLTIQSANAAVACPKMNVNDPCANPLVVSLAQGQRTVSFIVATTSVTARTDVTLTARKHQDSRAATLTVSPAGLHAVALTQGPSVEQSMLRVSGAQPVRVNVHLDGPAPVGGATVQLSSCAGDPCSSTTFPLPVSVTVPEGLTSLPLELQPVVTAVEGSSDGLKVLVSGTFGESVRSATLYSETPAFGSLVLSRDRTAGGGIITATLTLNGPTFALQPLSTWIDDGLAATAGTFSFAPGSSSATATIRTMKVSSVRTASFAVNDGRATNRAYFTVTPPIVKLVLARADASAGVPLGGVVYYNGPGGDPVNITRSDGGPPQTIVPARSVDTYATFSLTPYNITPMTVTATDGVPENNQAVTVTVFPTNLMIFAVAPTTIMRGQEAVATISLNQKAPAGGVPVTVTSTNHAVALIVTPEGLTASGTITVPENADSVTFKVRGTTNYTATSTHIRAEYNGVTITRLLGVGTNSIQSVVATPAEIVTGSTGSVTITMAGAAGPDGILLELSSSNACISVPAQVTIPNGQSSITVAATTSPGSVGTATITARYPEGYGEPTGSATINVVPLRLTYLTLQKTRMKGGTSQTATVTLNGNAFGMGYPMSIAKIGPLTAPTSVQVPPGSASTTFTLTGSSVSLPADASVTATATSGGAQATAILTVAPPITLWPRAYPEGIYGPTTRTFTIEVAEPVAAAQTITISKTGPVTVPATTTIAAGTYSKTFTATIPGATTDTAASVTVTDPAASTSSTYFTVKGPVLTGFSIEGSPAWQSGATATGTVSINVPAPTGGLQVIIDWSGMQYVDYDSPVVIPAGSTSANFEIRARYLTEPYTQNMHAFKPDGLNVLNTTVEVMP